MQIKVKWKKVYENTNVYQTPDHTAYTEFTIL